MTRKFILRAKTATWCWYVTQLSISGFIEKSAISGVADSQSSRARHWITLVEWNITLQINRNHGGMMVAQCVISACWNLSRLRLRVSDKLSTSGGINRKYFLERNFHNFWLCCAINRCVGALSNREVTNFYSRLESFELGEKRSCVRLWTVISRRRAQRIRRTQQDLTLESIFEDSLESIAPNTPSSSFWRMWHVGTMPGKLGDAFSILLRYAQHSFSILLCPM